MLTFLKKNISHKLFLLVIFIFIGIFIYFSLSSNLVFFVILSSIFLYMTVVSLFTYFLYPNIAKTKPFPKRVPHIAAVTYAYNNWTAVKKTVAQLKKIHYPIKVDIYVITDGTCSFLNKIKDVNVIELPKKYFRNRKNVKATVMNLGLKKIDCDYFLCVDGDTIPNRDILMKMTGFMNENVAVVNGVLLPSNNNSLLEKLQTLEYNFGWGISLRVLSALNSISVAVGGMCLIDKKKFIEVGYYDENNLTEDRELAYRFIEHGYVIRCAQDARGKTEVPNKLKAFFNQRLRWYSGEIATICKHKRFLFNKQKDVFGLIVLPYTFLMQMVGVGLICRLVIFNLRDKMLFIYHYLVLAISKNVWSLSLPNHIYFPSTTIMGVMIICLFIMFALLAFSFSRFHLSYKYYFSFIIFSSFYGAFLLIIYVYSMLREFIGCDYRWIKS